MEGVAGLSSMLDLASTRSWLWDRTFICVHISVCDGHGLDTDKDPVGARLPLKPYSSASFGLS